MRGGPAEFAAGRNFIYTYSASPILLSAAFKFTSNTASPPCASPLPPSLLPRRLLIFSPRTQRPRVNPRLLAVKHENFAEERGTITL